MTNYIKNDAGLLVPFAPAIIKRNYIEGGASHRNEMTGEYRLEVRRADGSLKQDTGWFKNLILDSGLNRIGSGVGVGGCAVGTGAAPPTVTQSGLQARSAWTITTQSNVYTAQPAAPYYYQAATTYRFALGALNGNYTEVGVGWTENDMFSRALIVNDVGAPTPLTVLSDEQLDVTYRLRMYHPTSDWGGTYTISGATYTVIGRSSVATSNSWTSFGAPTQQSQGLTPAHRGWPGGAIYYAGAISADATGSPSGQQASNGAVYPTQIAYSNNSFSRSATLTNDLNQVNISGGIRSVQLSYPGGVTASQYQFDPPIPKNNTRTLNLTFSTSWARRP
jgi:hypothetical protein